MNGPEQNLYSLSIDHPIRRSVDEGLRDYVVHERVNNVTRSREGTGYINQLGGLEHLLDYGRSFGVGSKVLDIGTGIGLAIGEIARSPFGRDLDFWATTLPSPGYGYIYSWLDQSKILYTSAEYLEGIEDKSIAICLAVASIMYSSYPAYAIRRIDEVLVPGGALKATFYTKSDFDEHVSNHRPFVRELVGLGYDIHICQTIGMFEAVLAIKPGGQGMRAKTLIEMDRNSRIDQWNSLDEAVWDLYIQDVYKSAPFYQKIMWRFRPPEYLIHT
jgi:hypothetical protein